MVVYVEYVIINNMIINSVILYLSALLTRRRPIWWQILIGSAIGAIYSTLSPLIVFKGNIVIKITLSLVMCAVSTRYRDCKEYLTYLLAFYSVTFLCGGVVIGLSNLSIGIKEAIYSPNNCHIAIIILIITVVFVISKTVVRRYNVRRSVVFEKPVTISVDGVNYTEQGYLDSGNTIYYKGLYPVIVVKTPMLNKPIAKLKVRTAVSSLEMPLYKIDSLIIASKTYRNVYAIQQRESSQYDVILHSSMI